MSLNNSTTITIIFIITDHDYDNHGDKTKVGFIKKIWGDRKETIVSVHNPTQVGFGHRPKPELSFEILHDPLPFSSDTHTHTLYCYLTVAKWAKSQFKRLDLVYMLSLALLCLCLYLHLSGDVLAL